MGTFTVALAVVASSVAQSGPIKAAEVTYQSDCFQRWWGAEIEWRFDELPTEGTVPKYRVPYSGHDYPDRGGGTAAALRKYDLAFNGRRPLAGEWERQDTGGDGRTRPAPWEFGRGLRYNLFARAREPDVPGWYGHCNGWTAAAIRHAEPQTSVRRNGVLFTPADIKGLLAEVYMYSDSEFLGGEDYAIHPALFHVVLTNWLGRGSHPVAMESTLGPEKWNYPIYSFASTHAERSGNTVEVKLNAAYSMSTRREYNRSEHIKRVKYFHYTLSLDETGKIVGGSYYRDSSRVDMLWVPRRPVQGGQEGNLRGNPYVDVDTVLALWRESVPEEIREKWLNIDPTEEDRIESRPADALEPEAVSVDSLPLAAREQE